MRKSICGMSESLAHQNKPHVSPYDNKFVCGTGLVLLFPFGQSLQARASLYACMTLNNLCGVVLCNGDATMPIYVH